MDIKKARILKLNWCVGSVSIIDESTTEKTIRTQDGQKVTEDIECITSYFQMKPENLMYYDELPTEFFNHQLLEINHENIGDLLEFSKKWGFIYSPVRNIGEYKEFLNPLEFVIDRTNTFDSVLISPELEVLEHIDAIRQTDEYINKIGDSEALKAPVISLSELSHSVLLLQESVNLVMGYDSFFPSWFELALEVFNRCSCNENYFETPVEIKANNKLYDRGLLTSAICNQVLETFSSDLPWKKCANEKCFKHFKRKQSGATSSNSKTKYCSIRCEQQQKKRNQRRAAMNRNNPTR